MLTLKDYVNWGLTHCDKTASAEGVPLTMENCVKNRKMKQLEVYGNSVQDGTPTPENPIEVESVGELVTDKNDINYGKYKIPVTVRGKNLFKPTKVSGSAIKNDGVLVLKGSYGTTIDSTDFSDNKVVVTQVANESYASGFYQNGYFNFLIPELISGKRYTISFDMNITNNPLNATAFNVYVGTTQNKALILSSISRYKYTFEFIPRTDRPQQVEIRCGGMSFELSNVMITEEGQDDTFEPYIEPITTNVYLNEPLRRIGDYADVLDFKNKKVIRNTLKRVYDGVYDSNNPFNKADNETSWDVDNANDNFFLCTLSDSLPVIPKNGYADFNHKPLCVQLPTLARVNNSTAASAVAEEQIWYTNAGRNVRLFLSKTREGLGDGSASALRAYLNANPITVYCAIHESYEEPIECELPILETKTSIVEIDTALLPSNIKGKYIKK